MAQELKLYVLTYSWTKEFAFLQQFTEVEFTSGSYSTLHFSSTIIVYFRFYIHRQWQVLKNLNIPHDPPSILGLGNLGPILKDPDSVCQNYKTFFCL